METDTEISKYFKNRQNDAQWDVPVEFYNL